MYSQTIIVIQFFFYNVGLLDQGTARRVEK